MLIFKTCSLTYFQRLCILVILGCKNFINVEFLQVLLLRAVKDFIIVQQAGLHSSLEYLVAALLATQWALSQQHICYAQQFRLHLTYSES